MPMKSERDQGYVHLAFNAWLTEYIVEDALNASMGASMGANLEEQPMELQPMEVNEDQLLQRLEMSDVSTQISPCDH